MSKIPRATGAGVAHASGPGAAGADVDSVVPWLEGAGLDQPGDDVVVASLVAGLVEGLQGLIHLGLGLHPGLGSVDQAHGYGMTKVDTPASSAWADWVGFSLDVMTTG